MTLCPTCPHKDRSPEEHRTLFGAIGKAFDNWPESHKFQPTSAEHLRAWLLIEVGHCEAIEIEADALQMRIVKELVVFLLSGPKARWGRSGDRLVIFRPKSLALEKCSKKEFRVISAEIDKVLKAETGIGVEEYVAEAKRSAA